MKEKSSQLYSIKNNSATKFQVKDVDSESRTVCAVLNTFNYLDSDGDVLLSGCCSDSIKKRGVDSMAHDKIVHALFHDITRLPGKIKLLEEREINGMKSLYMESKIADTTEGNDTLTNYMEGIYNQHSIGFRYLKGEIINREAHGNSKQWDALMETLINPQDAEKLGSIYKVSKIELYEGSTVAFGANTMTPCLGVKSSDKKTIVKDYMNRIDLLEKTLTSGKQSDEMMYLLEIQLLQIKQSFHDIFIHLTKAAAKQTCPECGASVLSNDEDICPECGESMKEKENGSFLSRLAKEQAILDIRTENNLIKNLSQYFAKK